MPATRLITAALPYANGPLHLGHMVEWVEADTYARFRRMQGDKVVFVSGSDAHGTAIMLNAQKKGITPEALVEAVHQEHQHDLNAFGISLDAFGSTDSPSNHALSQSMYQAAQAQGGIETDTIEQAFDEEAGLFLPDRYIKGSCPRCNAPEQYGDNCEACGATYNPDELIDPVSVVSGQTPSKKPSEHYFLKLEALRTQLWAWMQAGHVPTSMLHKMKEWFNEPLRRWDISRDAPYFGIPIPDAPGKFFYVWLEAPVGYMAAQQDSEAAHGLSVEATWRPGSDVIIEHFIGKDIFYFHALFWPALLHYAGYRMPDAVHVHGFLTVNGEKMSKSRGTFLRASDYLKHFKPDCLRYYLASKLNGHIEDIDLNLQDFKQKVNADLVGKVINIASRCAGFIRKRNNNLLGDSIDDANLWSTMVDAGENIAASYAARNTNQAVRQIMALADQANQYIDYHKPWALAKEEGQDAKVIAITTMGINAFRLLCLYLKPILPHLAEDAEAFLHTAPMTWNDHRDPLLNHTIMKFKPLMQRIDDAQLDALIHHEV
jgi:methionyl-tRNA synthetase